LVDETDPRIAARLEIELKDGRRVNENVFYRLMEGRIERVWSIVVCKGTS
jgi:predicted ester cyclase